MGEHNSKAEALSKRMEELSEKGIQPHITHGTTHSTRPGELQEDNTVNVGHLDQFLEINEEEQYAVLEPNIRMDELVAETLKHGILPPVVPEFPGITVGGAINGGAGESSSFKWGMFHHIFKEYEMVLGNGEIVTASPKENEDLFYGAAGSYGTLGVLTKAKINLIPAKKYVRLKYHRVNSYKEAIGLIKEKSKEDVDYIDGIMYSENLGTVMVGNLTDKKEGPIETFTNLTDEWFYIHAKKAVKEKDEKEETIPIQDYLFRYDRGAFWTGKHFYNLLNLPYNRLTRTLLNPWFTTQHMYDTLHSSNAGNYFQRFLVQDIALPKEKTQEFIEWEEHSPHIHPLWLCPIKPTEEDKLAPGNIDTDIAINVGIWGVLPKDKDPEKTKRNVEGLVKDLGGRKWLYAHQYYPEKEFWEIYDKDWYNEIREEYHAKEAFPDLYERTKVDPEELGELSLLNGIIEFLKPPKRMKIEK